MSETQGMGQEAWERATGNTRLGVARPSQPPSFTARARRLIPILVYLAIFPFLQGRGLPPMVAMVLDQYPSTREKRYGVVLAAERHLRAAGIQVIASEYIPRHDGARDWHVSPWEGHPNEKANRVFADEILKVLRDLPELQPYRRQVGTPPGARFGERRWAA